MDKRIPSSKCPSCGHLHRFDGVDMSEAARRARTLGPGAVIACAACATVNKLANNLALTAVNDLEFLKSEPVRALRWQAVETAGIDPPDDLLVHTALAAADEQGGDLIVVDPSAGPTVSTMAVWPDETSPVDYGFVVSVTGEHQNAEFIVTGVYPASAELVFRVLAAAWPQIDGVIACGQRFTFEALDGFEYVLAPVWPERLGLPQGNFVQVLWQNEHDRWPWDEGGDWMPVIAGDDWRPDDNDPAVLSFTAPVEGMLTTEA